VDTLQGWNPEQYETWGILGNAYISSNGLEMRPISLLNRKTLPRPINSPVLHLTLDTLQTSKPVTIATPASAAPAATQTAPASSEAGELEEEPEELAAEAEEPVAGGHTAIGQLLRAACAELEQLAERGARASSPALEGRLRDLAERLREVGVTTCAAALTTVARHLEANRHQISPETEETALALLRAYYLLRLALEQSAVTEALAAYDCQLAL
jgi:predicted component of type VI protein secretion system